MQRHDVLMVQINGDKKWMVVVRLGVEKKMSLFMDLAFQFGKIQF